MSLSNGVVRIITAVVGIPAVVAATYFGGWPFILLVLAGALLAQRELYTILGQTGIRSLSGLGLLLGLLVGLRSMVPPTIPLAVALGLAVYVLLSSRFERPWQSLSATLMGVFYPTMLLTFFIDIRLGSEVALTGRGAFWLTLSVFIFVWASDTAAYYVGKGLGRRPLARTISPGKTWEGSIGGAIGAVVAAGAVWSLELVGISWYHLLAIGLICGVVGQLGDLAESRIKRIAGVKDSGSLLPGHGGVLDRLDALVIAVPLAYIYLSLVTGIL